MDRCDCPFVKGRHGKISDLNPLLFASLYAFNRHDTKPRLKYWLKRGKVVVLDRYSSANWGHQASKCASDEERHKVIGWLDSFEHKWLGLPRSDITLYLDLPPLFALKAMQQDATRAALDIHETAGFEYKNRVRDTFLWCCEQFPTWKCVPCVETPGGNLGDVPMVRLSKEAVHKSIYDAVAPLIRRLAH